jgi:Helicase C-terminal domain
MTNYSTLFQDIDTLYSTRKDPILTKPLIPFPLPQIYPQQQNLIMEASGDKSLTYAITSHTGAGKTPVFLSLCRNIPSIVIEPRKFLQVQCASYYKDFVLFGRSEYACQYAPSAATAPCNRKVSCDTTLFHDTCHNSTGKCLDKPCRIFEADGTWQRYPCNECQYIRAQIDAKNVLKHNGTVICNFGNFWSLLNYAKLVVIDEADLFFREIAKPTKLFYSTPKKNDGDTIASLLQREVRDIQEAIKTSPSSQVYSLQNALYNAQFLLGQAELCFKYQRKDKMYIEISPDKVGVLKDKIFHDKKVILVSATLGEFDIPRYSYSVWQRRGIFYAPVGKMTSRELGMKPWLIGKAAEQIEAISSIAEGKYDTHKFPIHTGNLGNHGAKLLEALGDDKCTMHERGQLMQTIDKFVDDTDKRYLIVAGADYGGDFTFAKMQFVLKFPYASLDERMRTLERVMGKAKFNQYYTNEAITRVVQACGRVCRGYGDFGATIVLDSKFMEIYRQKKRVFPDWFCNSFNERVY